MDKKYIFKNTNLEKIDQINIVTRYVSSTFGRPSIVLSKYKYPYSKLDDDKVYTIILDKDKLIINNSLVNCKSFNENPIDNLHIQKDSFVIFIFNGVIGRAQLLDMINSFFQKGCKAILVEPYSLALCIGLGIQHCIIIKNYDTYIDVYIIDEYVLHDSFTVYKTSRQDVRNIPVKVYVEDYVEEYQKVRLTEDTKYYGCKICDYKSKDLNIAIDHLKVAHIFEKDTNMLYNYENKHGELVEELIKRLKFLYFNLDRLKRLNIRVISDYSNNELLVDQLKYIYNNVTILPHVDEDFVYKGNEIFNSLDISNECWMTDKEWIDWGLRALKDKILFNI